jgi:hypothetical protein
MAILNYIPKKKEVIDRRTDNGGYYEAVCDECGNVYYPKRSNAKYCSRSCTVMAYRRKKKAEGPKIKKEKVNEDLILVKTLPAKDMSWYLKKNYSSDTDNLPMYVMKEDLVNLTIGETKKMGKIVIKKYSANKYQLYQQL